MNKIIWEWEKDGADGVMESRLKSWKHITSRFGKVINESVLINSCVISEQTLIWPGDRRRFLDEQQTHKTANQINVSKSGEDFVAALASLERIVICGLGIKLT